MLYMEVFNVDELKKLLPNRKLSNERETIFGTGCFYPTNIIEPIKIKDEERSGHVGVFGTTRTGKTRLIESIIEQDIKKGYNVVIIDPKGDIDLLSKVINVTIEYNRSNDFMFLTPIYPQFSIKLDPLAYYYMEDELVDHVISGIQAKEDFYIAVAAEVTQTIVHALILKQRHKKEKVNINFYEIKKYATHADLKKLKEEVQYLPGSEQVLFDINQILNSPPDFFAKISSSLRTTLTALSSGAVGQIIGKAKSNEFINRFEEGKGVILYCNTGSMLARRYAHIVGRVLVSMVQSAVGRFFASGRKLSPPLCIHIDEGQNILYNGIQELFAKGGGANAWVHFYCQSIAQIEEAITQSGARSMLDNINTKIFMLVNHPDTAKYLENIVPERDRSASYLGLDGEVTIRPETRKIITADKVTMLPKRHFYMLSYGRIAKGVTNDVYPSKVRVLLPNITSVQDERFSSNENK